MTEPQAGEHESRPAGRDKRAWSKMRWTGLPEWLNAFSAVGTLGIGVATLWTTAQISGIEDYLRSEISRRNNDLNALSDRTRRLTTVSEERAARLEQLRGSTEQIIASNLAAQDKLIGATQELGRVNSEVSNARTQVAAARTRLADLDKVSADRLRQIDGLQRERLYGQEVMRLTFDVFIGDERASGERAYQSIASVKAGSLAPEPLTSEYRRRAKDTCRGLRGINPDIPPEVSYPQAPSPPGRREATADGVSFWMTPQQRQRWKDDQKAWNSAYAAASARNDQRQKAMADASDQIMKAAHACICAALVTADNPAEKVCR